MTKEELEKEAIAKYKTGSYPQLHPDHWAFVHGYLAGAEPKEKRIVELEAQIEKMKCCGNCDWSNYLPNGNCLDCDGKKNWKLKEIKEK